MAAASAPAQAKIDGYPCPQCGAPTAFKPGTHDLWCDHCDTRVTIARSTTPILTYDFYGKTSIAAVGAAQLVAGGREAVCKNCGARSVMTKQAQRCAFCDSPMVAEVESDAQTIPPGGVLPFMLERGKAGDNFARWLKSRWFAPGDLVKRARRDGLDGVYLPFWAYDAQTHTTYVGERGEHYWETETYTENGETKTREVQKTRWWPASGAVDVPFQDVLVCGSPSLPEPMIRKLEPWDLPNVVPFDGRYLAGFVAERYRIDQNDSFETAKVRMDPVIRRTIESDIGGDEQRILSKDVSYATVGFRHVMMPLWLTAFHYRDRVFHVMVNASTGEVQGERPWSALKITLFVLTIVAIIIAIVVLVKQH